MKIWEPFSTISPLTGVKGKLQHTNIGEGEYYGETCR